MDYDVQSAASGVATSAINDLGDVANLNKTEARAALLHFFGHDNCVTRAEAEAARLRDAIVAHRATKMGVTRVGQTKLNAVVDRIIHLDAADLALWDALYAEDGDDDD